jgi:hypothetical protein
MFKVRRETNTWNRWGAKVNAVETTVLETENLEEAWRYHRRHYDPQACAAADAVRHTVVDEEGRRAPLVLLYQDVIGDDEFRKQEILEGFFIDLDDWLDDRIARDVPLHETEILDEWLDHDEGVRVIKTRFGFRYEPISKKRQRTKKPLDHRTDCP